ncbi:MAG TPA: M48 family metallopeptidase [Gemmatimonadaceae bacterium]|jgi:predicted Zn-dependent protease|nr:M48 family metallopeptidase [Gemmatimonadaceae bacterium]
MKRFVAGAAIIVAASACAVSTQQEVALGTDYSRQINAQLPIVSDPEVDRYINVLGDSIARLSDERQLDWHFFVVDSKEVNAFAVPGGFIYVNRGLIERAENMSMLAGVLGHEIAHVTERHSIQQMQKAQGANVGISLACILTRVCESQATGALINVAGGAVFARFSREDESESDRKAVEYVVRAGIDPRGIPAMFEVLMRERQRRPEGVEAWFTTHPLAEDRIENTRALIAQIDPLILQSLSTDSRNFQAFKQRVASLPPSPPSRSG